MRGRTIDIYHFRMNYELSFDAYKGPLDKLLELIEEKKLEITTIALAEVTADFLKYIETLEAEGRKDAVADFLVIASKLILIKSKTLLPSLPLSEEEELDIHSLEIRLKIYRELKRGQAHIKERWSTHPQMAEREFLMSTAVFFFPPSKMTLDDLRRAMRKVAGEMERIMRPVETVKAEIIHLKQKIQEIIERISDVPFSFSDMHKGKKRGEVIVLFMALLHLIKDQIVRADQSDHFSDIVVAKVQKTQ